MKAIISIAARMSSSRLPGKVLAEVDGEPILQRIIERLLPVNADVVVANNGCDPEIADLCRRMEVCGAFAPVDVMAIHHRAMVTMDADILLLAGADDPFLDPAIFDLVLERMERGDVEYTMTRGWPLGLNVWGISRRAMDDANRLATAPDERQHVVPFFERRPRTYRQAVLHRAGEDLYSRFRLTLDEPADLELVRAVYARVPWNASAEDIIAFLDQHPEIVALNADGLQGTAARDAIYPDLSPVDTDSWRVGETVLQPSLIRDIRSHVEVSRRAALATVPETGLFAEGQAAAMLSFGQWLEGRSKW